MKAYPGEKVLAIIFFVFSLLAMYFSYHISGFSSMSSPGSFPMFVSFILFISSIFVLNEVHRKHQKHAEVKSLDDVSSSDLMTGKSAVNYLFPRLVLIFFFASLVYVFLIVRLSFIYASILFLFFTGIYFKNEKLHLNKQEFIRIGIISILLVASIYFIFHNIFKVLLP